MNYWGFTKMESFGPAKEAVAKTKRQATEWGRYLQVSYQIKGWYPRSIKNVSNVTPKKQMIQ